jgi:hypothetical protein
MRIDDVPLALVLLATTALVLAALHAGVRVGRRTVRGGAKFEVSGAVVGATMGLLAFMLAFTFNSAAVRHDARKALVIREANAIETTWLRAGFLPDGARTQARELLREYVGVRVKAAGQQIAMPDAVRQSEDIQDRMWAVAEDAGRREPTSETVALFVDSLNEVIDLHLERLTVAIRNRVPTPTWVTLYAVLIIGMFMMGAQIGQSGTRHVVLELALALSFSLVVLMIADLDRPQQGFVRVSQQAMTELHARLGRR